MTKVVNIRHSSYDVYIGRAGRGFDGYFGNPFKLKDNSPEARKECCDSFKTYFYKRIKEDLEFRERILNLKDKTLGCFCAPLQCHGDVICEYLDGSNQEEGAWD